MTYIQYVLILGSDGDLRLQTLRGTQNNHEACLDVNKKRKREKTFKLNNLNLNNFSILKKNVKITVQISMDAKVHKVWDIHEG